MNPFARLLGRRDPPRLASPVNEVARPAPNLGPYRALPAAPREGSRPRRLPSYEVLEDLPYDDGEEGRGRGQLVRLVDDPERRHVVWRTAAYGDRAFMQLAVDELHCLTWLAHPNLARVAGVGIEADDVCVITDYEPGASLFRRLFRARPDLPTALALITCAADGLAVARRQPDAEGRPLGVVHRELSPKTIYVSDAGGVRVTGFATFPAMRDCRSGFVRPMPTFVAYLSPDAAKGRPDGQRDVFALGAMLWELACHRRLFAHDRPDDLELLARVVACDAPAPSSVMPALPAAFDDLVLRALARNPEDRHPDPDALADALRALLASGAVGEPDLAAYARASAA